MTGVDEAVALLRTMGPGDAALVKGSRVARLEDVVHAYEEAAGERCWLVQEIGAAAGVAAGVGPGLALGPLCLAGA